MCVNPIIAAAIWEAGAIAQVPPSDLLSVPCQFARAVAFPLDKDASAVVFNLHH